MGRFDLFPIFIAIFASRRVTLIATHSKSQKQTRLPIRYLYFILPFKPLINKEVIKVFQNYRKTSKVCPFRLKKREDQKPFSHNDKNTYLCSMSEDTYKTIIYPQQSSRYRKIKEMKYEN